MVYAMRRMSVQRSQLGVMETRVGSTHLVRQGQGQLDLVRDGLRVATALDRSAEEGGTSPEGRASETEGAHCAIVGGLNRLVNPLKLVAKGRTRMPVVP